MCTSKVPIRSGAVKGLGIRLGRSTSQHGGEELSVAKRKTWGHYERKGWCVRTK